MSENATNEAHRQLSASVGVAIPNNAKHYGYLSEHHSFGQEEMEAGQYAEDLAAYMLATILGKDFDAARKTMDEQYLPFVLLSGGKSEGKLKLLKGKMVDGETTIYVCRDKTCKLPVTDAGQALQQLGD